MPETQNKVSAPFFDLAVSGQTLRLHAGRFAEWREEKTIFIADAHLGKIEHFRRAGIGLPAQAGDDTFQRLTSVMQAMHPKKLFFLGDLFHSAFNADFPRFAEWRKQFPETDVCLIPGNHDRAGKNHLHQLGIAIQEPHAYGPFFLRHEPGDTTNGFLLCGHLHPGVSLSGCGRQHLRVPAFWQFAAGICLPAFGTFTGRSATKANAGDIFYAISGSSVHKVPAELLVG